MSNIKKWCEAILQVDTDKMSMTSVRNIQLIKQEFERLQEENKELKSNPSPTGDRDCEELKKEVERLKWIVKSAHYAGWYNGMVNAYKHEFSWDEFSKTNNL